MAGAVVALAICGGESRAARGCPRWARVWAVLPCAPAVQGGRPAGVRQGSSKKPAEFMVTELGQTHPDQSAHAGPPASSELRCVHSNSQMSAAALWVTCAPLPPPRQLAARAPHLPYFFSRDRQREKG